MNASIRAQQRGLMLWVISLVAIGFGLMTIKEGGTVLFGDEVVRAAAGSYVPFVLWFNFLAGFAYVVAGAGLWRGHRWALCLGIAIAIASLFVFAALVVHINSGAAYEKRTVIAMSLRILVWLTISAIAWRGVARRVT
jgi:hypothetical protein